jgi:hypothetical protein
LLGRLQCWSDRWSFLGALSLFSRSVVSMCLVPRLVSSRCFALPSPVSLLTIQSLVSCRSRSFIWYQSVVVGLRVSFSVCLLPRLPCSVNWCWSVLSLPGRRLRPPFALLSRSPLV